MIRKPASHSLAFAAVAWALAGALLALSDRLLRDLLWVGEGLVWALFACSGLVLLIVIAMRTAKDRSPASLVLLLAYLGAGLALWVWGGWLGASGDRLLFRYRFAHSLGTYERVVASLSAAPRESPATGAPTFVLDSGPPIRVAFPLPGGILDNWEGVVYDPTGEVLRARGWGPGNTFTAPPAIRSLFGGDLVICRLVRRPYYRCWFT